MRSRDEATSASTNELKNARHRAHAPRRPRELPVPAPAAPVRELDESAVLESLPVADPAPAGSGLRRLLVVVDLVAAVVGWVLVVGAAALVNGTTGRAAQLLAIVGIGVAALMFMVAGQGLYRSRVCAVRAVETARLGRAAAIAAALALIVATALGLPFGWGQAIGAMAVTWVLLSTARSLYAAWLSRSRSQGRFCRPVVVIGTGDEGYELFKLVDLHPEMGLRVAGVIGPRRSLARWDGEVEWLGEIADAGRAVQAAGANGVIVAVSDLHAHDLNGLTRELLGEGVHIQLSSGLRGIDQRRLRSLPLAHEPLFYLEPASLSRWQLGVKRVMDVAIAGTLLVLASPILLVAAIAIKLGDGGSVLFRQTRVGQDGCKFELLKLRTMVPNAEERLVDLTFANERTGPLFKLTQDPRRTKVGRILEKTSLDELPQLINVLRGDMSLVGPRPALPHEVAEFDEELRGRHRVLPGITGLWQVEGRENPEFDVYRRLDLFYVENWSVGFDLAILLATAQSVLLRFAWSSKSSSDEATKLELSPAVD